MKKYLHLVQDLTTYNSFIASNDYIEPNVTYVKEEHHCWFNPIDPHDYSQDYLTIVSTVDNNIIKWQASNVNIQKTISVSTDDGQTWTNKTSSTKGIELATLNNGDKLLIKGNNTSYATSSYYNRFKSTQNFEIEGNIMSLLYGDNFIGETSLSGKNYAFKNLFWYNSNVVVNAQNLILPATTLATNCYREMFEGCNSLATAPTLPATTLEDSCYREMFYGCNSLTTAPALPATTLATSCYYGMFYNCSSLTTAPALPATTLAASCYYQMFYHCTSLTTAPALPATTLAYQCYYNMFPGCTSLTTVPELPATILTTKCYYAMFVDCTSLTTAPELPAITLANSCYYQMFANCTSLSRAPELPATILTESCYVGMFQGCSSLNYIKCLATDISASSCTANWVSNVAATGTFIKDTNMSGWTTGTDGIPSGWTTQDATN